MSKPRNLVAAGLFGIAVLGGLAAAGSTDHEAGTNLRAVCEYTDRTNCDYDGEY
jgi:hypothetical protein